MLAERVVQWTEKWKQEGLQQGMQQGIQQGIQQGMQQGMQQGEAAVLERLLKRRFGPLPADTQARLAGASLEQLEHWADAILDAKSLEEVFAEH